MRAGISYATTNLHDGKFCIVFWLVALIAIGIIFVGACFIVAPLPAARGFGVPASETERFTYLWTKGTRNVAALAIHGGTALFRCVLVVFVLRGRMVMSLVFSKFDHSIVKRAADAEIVGASTAKIRLLVDSSATGGALSTVRVTLEKGADGARPHRHDRSAEMFYVLGGAVRVSRALRSSRRNRVMSSSCRRGCPMRSPLSPARVPNC